MARFKKLHSGKKCCSLDLGHHTRGHPLVPSGTTHSGIWLCLLIVSACSDPIQTLCWMMFTTVDMRYTAISPATFFQTHKGQGYNNRILQNISWCSLKQFKVQWLSLGLVSLCAFILQVTPISLISKLLGQFFQSSWGPWCLFCRFFYHAHETDGFSKQISKYFSFA